MSEEPRNELRQPEIRELRGGWLQVDYCVLLGTKSWKPWQLFYGVFKHTYAWLETGLLGTRNMHSSTPQYYPIKEKSQ